MGKSKPLVHSCVKPAMMAARPKTVLFDAGNISANVDEKTLSDVAAPALTVTGLNDHVPIMPGPWVELREVIEYAVSIALAFVTGNILGMVIFQILPGTMVHDGKPNPAAFRMARMLGADVGEDQLRRRARIIQDLLRTAGPLAGWRRGDRHRLALCGPQGYSRLPSHRNCHFHASSQHFMVRHSRNAAMKSAPGARENDANHGKITVLGVSAVSEFLIIGWHHGWLDMIG